MNKIILNFLRNTLTALNITLMELLSDRNNFKCEEDAIRTAIFAEHLEQYNKHLDVIAKK